MSVADSLELVRIRTAVERGRAASAAYTTETNSTIGASPKDVVAAKADRAKLKIQNTSIYDYRIKTTGAASASDGMLLPAGSFYEWEAHDIPVGALSVYSPTTGATATYFVAEG